MALFAKAAAKVASQVGGVRKEKKSTTWVVGDTAQGKKVAEAVHELVGIKAQMRTLEAKEKLHKTIVQSHAYNQFFETYASIECFPETPMVVQNNDGEKVTFVVQDRSGQYAAKDDQLDMLIQILGEDAARNLVYEETAIGFDRVVLAMPGVSEVIEKSLERAISKLVSDDILTAELAESLIVATMKRSFKPGIPERLVQVCGKDTGKMRAVCDALGSSMVKYVKA